MVGERLANLGEAKAAHEHVIIDQEQQLLGRAVWPTRCQYAQNIPMKVGLLDKVYPAISRVQPRELRILLGMASIGGFVDDIQRDLVGILAVQIERSQSRIQLHGP